MGARFGRPQNGPPKMGPKTGPRGLPGALFGAPGALFGAPGAPPGGSGGAGRPPRKWPIVEPIAPQEPIVEPIAEPIADKKLHGVKAKPQKFVWVKNAIGSECFAIQKRAGQLECPKKDIMGSRCP